MIQDEIEKLVPSKELCRDVDAEKCSSGCCHANIDLYRNGVITILLTAHAEGKIILVTEDMVERLARYLYCSENSPKAFEKYIKEAQQILTFLKGAKE